ncbi:preprotein translocase subunit SecY [Poriferisphaera sp. WC338]|uniref:preprotein translocase subunit SecY n=1 Tax=Poriferisphaera sp. WC338 TaxID=3425129 RepID=UPI003D8127C7
MLQAFFNIWRIRELRVKLLFTVGMLAIYRIGFFIPLPGVDQSALKTWADQSAGGAVGNLISYVQIFTGGSLGQSTIFGLGIMPYISAAIIFQLLGTVWEPLKQLQKEGPAGRQKIQEYTRYATVALCLVQAAFWISFLQSGQNPFVYPEYIGTISFWLSGIVGLTAGTVFLMWLGEQIDKYGIGNGVSLIITAGIIAGMPNAIGYIYKGFSLTSGEGDYTPMSVLFLIGAFIAVVAGSIIITQGQRRIPIQQAKHTRGRRVYGGQKSYLPLRVNHGGVMPIIFAQSLMIFPSMIVGWIASTVPTGATGWWVTILGILNDNFANLTGYLYVLTFIGMIYFFAYFWTTVQFQPKEMANQLRDHGSFIPGRRPGPRTAEYLETVMERITYVGAGFLAIIAVIPTIVTGLMGVDFSISQYLGGTGLLIVVSVMLDFVQRIEAQLLMRNYPGFLAQGDAKGPKIRGARH